MCIGECVAGIHEYDVIALRALDQAVHCVIDSAVLFADGFGGCVFKIFCAGVFAAAVLDEPFVIFAVLCVYGCVGALKAVEIVKRYGGDCEAWHGTRLVIVNDIVNKDCSHSEIGEDLADVFGALDEVKGFGVARNNNC